MLKAGEGEGGWALAGIGLRRRARREELSPPSQLEEEVRAPLPTLFRKTLRDDPAELIVRPGFACPADICYIRLTCLPDQEVSFGLQFLHKQGCPSAPGLSPLPPGRVCALSSRASPPHGRACAALPCHGKRKGRRLARQRPFRSISQSRCIGRFPAAVPYFPFAALSMSATILSTAEHVGQPPAWEPPLQPPSGEPPWQQSHDPPESHSPRPIIRRTASATSTARISSTTAVEKFISSGAMG